MKKKIAAIIAAAGLAAAGTIYPTTMIITDTNEAQDLVTMSTASGLEYQFYGIEDYFAGDLVSCIMFDNFTPDDVRDDIILAHRYSGVTEFFDNIITVEY